MTSIIYRIFVYFYKCIIKIFFMLRVSENSLREM